MGTATYSSISKLSAGGVFVLDRMTIKYYYWAAEIMLDLNAAWVIILAPRIHRKAGQNQAVREFMGIEMKSDAVSPEESSKYFEQ